MDEMKEEKKEYEERRTRRRKRRIGEDRKWKVKSKQRKIQISNVNKLEEAVVESSFSLLGKTV